MLEEEQIMYLPYYRQVAYSEANISALWMYSQFSLNPNRVSNAEEKPDEVQAR